MTVYNRSSGQAEVIDARETAPAAASQNMYNGNGTLATVGGLAVAVPSTLSGLWAAHQRYGSLPWADLFQPSIPYCINGHRVTASMARALQQEREAIINEPSLSSIYVDPTTGDVYKENDTVYRTQLGQTYTTLASEGIDTFYSGEMAAQLVADMNKYGAIITTEDMAGYQTEVRPPVVSRLLSDLTVYGVPPPGSGALVAFILNILEGYNGTSGDDITDAQRIVESFKFAYAKRTYLGDENFVNVTAILANLTSKEYAAEIRAQIHDNETFDPSYYGPATTSGTTVDHGTSQLSVLSADGDAVSVTLTINSYFGALFRSVSTGVILNNEMDDFSSPNITNYYDVAPTVANYIAPGKRPLSSMAPTILVGDSGDVRLICGTAGGILITSATALVTEKVILNGEDLVTATDSLRLHHQLYPNIAYYETGYSQDVLDGLVAIGHNISVQDGLSIVNSVQRLSNGELDACSDTRIDGGTAGY